MTFLCVLAVIGTAFGFICWLWGGISKMEYLKAADIN